MGIFSNDKFPQEVFENIKESIEAIKYGIRTIATDFTKREEYNAYKHGLRIIPSVSKFMIADANTMEVKMELDLSESMSFYVKTKLPDELKVVTKVFDAERDYQMTYFCSNLINHLIFYRRIAMKFEKDNEKFTKIPITFFSKEQIEKCNIVNVDIADMVYTVTSDQNSSNKSKIKNNISTKET